MPKQLQRVPTKTGGSDTGRGQHEPVGLLPHPAASSAKVKRWRLRRLWLNIHLTLALTAGFLFVLMGLTGASNVFYREIDEWVEPALVIAHPGRKYRSLDAIMQAVRGAHPGRSGPWQIRMPRHPARMLTAYYQKPPETAHEFWAPLMVSVNPYTAEVVKTVYWGETLGTFIFEIHTELLVEEPGWYAVGILGLVLIVSLVTGIYLWWPARGKLKEAFTIKRSAGFARMIFDLHRVTGITFAMVLFILAVGGVYFVYPDYVQELVRPFSAVADGPEGLTSTVLPGVKFISVDQALARAKQVFPDAEPIRLTTPDGTAGVYHVLMRQPSEVNITYPSTGASIDQYSGAVLASRDYNNFTGGEKLLALLWSLHNGEALGLPGRILVCITGFVPLILYVTGIMQWLRKRRSKGHRANRLAGAQNS